MEINTRRTHVLWAESSELVSGISNKKSIHTFYHMLYILSGHGTYICDGQVHEISRNSLVLVPPHTVHELPAEGHSLMTFLEVKFEVRCPHISEKLRQLSPFLEGSQFVHDAMNYIVANWLRTEQYNQENVDAFLTALLLTLTMDGASPTLDTSRYLKVEEYSLLTQRIINYIERNFDDDFHLQELGAYLELNKNYLCDVFKENTGYTIIDYLNYVRIRTAISILYYGGNLMTTSVALYVGFTNRTHFTRTFNALTGVSPAIMRKLFEAEAPDASAASTDSDSAFLKIIGFEKAPIDKAFEALKALGEAAREFTAKNDIQ